MRIAITGHRGLPPQTERLAPSSPTAVQQAAVSSARNCPGLGGYEELAKDQARQAKT